MPGFPNQQSFFLWCYLLLNRRTLHSREHLSAVFWGDLPTKLARKNLRNTIWRLRQVFESVGASLDVYLNIDEDNISFENQADLWLDLEEFESCTSCNQDLSPKELTPEQVSSLKMATDLYLGDLLEGVYEDWCLYDRERLRLAYLNMLNKLMFYHGLQGNYEHSLDYGQRILALDNFREKVHRYMMWIHFLAGDREAALAQYRLCCKVLQDELGMHPMKETQRLYETILRNSPRPEDQAHHSARDVPEGSNMVATSRATDVLQKLHLLQMIVDQTNIELHLLEGMIHQALVDGDETMP